jgi:hypothetical protein
MFTNNDQFYPTPKELVFKMLDKLDEEQYKLAGIKHILEPNCGKGDIVQAYKEYFNNKYKTRGWSSRDADKELEFEVIEFDENLNSLLRGQNYNVVWDDFLSFDPPRFYDLIIMNPPFIDGDKHLMKAIQIQERVGGRILCLLNAETLKNPYTNTRKHLLKSIEKYNGFIEYIDNAFSDAERKTDVETAFIFIDVPMINMETMFEKEFKQDNPDLHVDNLQSLMPNMNKLEKLVFEYNMLKNATIELYKEKYRVDNLLKGFGIEPFVTINETGYTKEQSLPLNEFVDKINLKFWNKFITETDFKNKLPSKLRDTFNYNMEKQKNVAFTIENLRYFTEELMKAIPKSYEETCASVFDECTRKHCYSDASWNSNIHMYNGWKTNSAYKVNKKVIIPCYYSWSLYNVPDVLKDLNIIFNNISGSNYSIDTNEICKAIERAEKNIETEHFLLDSYKKGTIHIKFKNQSHLNVFNILAGKGKMWLPDDFMCKSYDNMTKEEKDLVSEFGLTPTEYNNLSLVATPNKYLRLN